MIFSSFFTINLLKAIFGKHVFFLDPKVALSKECGFTLNKIYQKEKQRHSALSFFFPVTGDSDVIKPVFRAEIVMLKSFFTIHYTKTDNCPHFFGI